ncbi:hypothetical protein [Bacillus massilinigeriensis]|uniref:hypothetical protein n=1 Tax=Bacillus mediterraneensis TaxID=1805474 RepID=UPI00114D4453|nr:hypothetical protein [Bacillus mediterraneensis]
MRTVVNVAGKAGALSVLYYLYQRQLGAISFFILSIYFFYLARKLMVKGSCEEKELTARKNHGNSAEKSTENNRIH